MIQRALAPGPFLGVVPQPRIQDIVGAVAQQQQNRQNMGTAQDPQVQQLLNLLSQGGTLQQQQAWNSAIAPYLPR